MGSDGGIKGEAKNIENVLIQRGIPKSEIDGTALMRAAETVFHEGAESLFDAYDQAVLQLREEYEKRGRVREGGEEIYPPGGKGKGPRTEEALIGDREGEPGAGAPGPFPRRKIETSPVQLEHLESFFVERTSKSVVLDVVASRPLSNVRRGREPANYDSMIVHRGGSFAVYCAAGMASSADEGCPISVRKAGMSPAPDPQPTLYRRPKP